MAQVEPLDGSRPPLQFSDGAVREIDCRFLMHGTPGEPLRDPDYVRPVRVDEESREIV